MDLGLTGKVAMIAAGSQGIGLASAQALAAEGCLISLCSRSEEKLAAARRSFPDSARIFTAVADVSDHASITRWFQETRKALGPVEILMTNTGGPPAGSALEVTDEQWQAGFDSTLLSLVRMVRQAVPLMREKKFGRIIHLTSLVAREPSSLLAISSTLRTGIDALTKLQARELGRDGITVNSVLPGHTLTDRQTHLAEIEAKKSGKSVATILAEKATHIPVGRIADPSEIGAVVTFLASRQAGYLTGESILVDGGLSK